MRLDEFQQLSEVAKGVAAMSGSYLTKRQIYGFEIALYAVDNFYAEIYHLYRTRAVAHIDGFREVIRLEPYLSTINVIESLEAGSI